MDKKFSQFTAKDTVADSDYVNVTGSGVNRRVSWPDFLDNIYDRIVTPFIYPTIELLKEAPLRADEDNPVYVRVEETEYRLYKITNIAPGANDITLDNGNTATAQSEYRDIGFVVGPETSTLGALATYDNETGTLLSDGPKPTDVGINLLEFPDSAFGGYFRKKDDNTVELLTASQLKTAIGLGNVNNTSDQQKVDSGPIADALALKADLESPSFTGNPTAPTPAADDDSESIATTQYVQGELSDRIQSVATIADLSLLYASEDKTVAIVAEYQSGTMAGGGEYRWDANRPKSDHNGGTVIAVGAPYPQDWNNAAEVAMWYDYSGGSLGCWSLITSLAVSIESFGFREGLIPDTQVIIFGRAANACKNGGTLDIGQYEYDFGYVGARYWRVFIDNPKSLTIKGHGALIRCRAVGGRASMICVRNPDGFRSEGVNFNDPDFDIVAAVGGGANRVGCYGYLFYATAPYAEDSPCGDIYLRGDAYNCMGFAACDATTQLGAVDAVFRGMRGVTVRTNCNTCYYSVGNVYAAYDFDLELDCYNVRRGFINYGGHTGKIRSTLKCSEGFIGANAYISLACESAIAGNVYDFDIDVTVTGVEAHEGIVTLYHQQDGDIGAIRNIRSHVTCNNVTTDGKAPGIGSLNIYRLVHEQTNGSYRNPTPRIYDGLSLRSSVTGYISGHPILLQSPPVNKTYKLETSSATNNLLPNFGMWLNFHVVTGARTQALTPVVYGGTTSGICTYASQRGVCSIVDGLVKCSMSVSWSGHTGTGPLKVGVLPVAAPSSATLGNPSVSIVASGFGPSGGVLSGAVTGSGAEISIYSTDITSRALTTVQVPASGVLTIDVSFPLYIN